MPVRVAPNRSHRVSSEKLFGTDSVATRRIRHRRRVHDVRAFATLATLCCDCLLLLCENDDRRYRLTAPSEKTKPNDNQRELESYDTGSSRIDVFDTKCVKLFANYLIPRFASRMKYHAKLDFVLYSNETYALT